MTEPKKLFVIHPELTSFEIEAVDWDEAQDEAHTRLKEMLPKGMDFDFKIEETPYYTEEK